MLGILGSRDKGTNSGPVAALGCLLAGFVILQCLLPLGTAIKIGADEDFELSKATLCLHGHHLYTEIWSDQPPLYVSLLTVILRHASPGILGPRLLTSAATLLLLGAFFGLVRRVNGLLAAALATAMLIASPGFLELSSSAMQEIPSLAPVVVGLWFLLALPQTKWPVSEALGAAFFAAALQMKLIGLIYLPLAALVLWLRYAQGPELGAPASLPASRLSSGRSNLQSTLCNLHSAIPRLALFAGLTALGFVTLNWLTGHPLWIQIEQSWAAHFASARSLEFGSPEEHAFDWTLLLKNWDLTVPALLGVVLMARTLGRVRAPHSIENAKAPVAKVSKPAVSPTSKSAGQGKPRTFHTRRAALLPLAWLVLTLAIFGRHKPWWAYYYIHNALPLCWCAGAGLAFALEHVRPRRQWAFATLLGLFSLCALLWMGARVWLQETGIRQAPKLYTCLALKEIDRFRPFTQFLFTDQPIYSFHSGIPVPPRLAILSLKRFWTGDLTTAQVVAELERVKPGLMFLANSTAELPYQALLNREYQLVYQDAANRLYAHRSIAKKAQY